MDKLRRELEALILKHPTEFSFVQELSQMSEQSGWTYAGKTVSEHIHAAVLDSGPKKNDYKVPLDQFSAFPFLGVSAVPPLLDAFQSGTLITQWKAAFALGQLGSAAITAIPTLILGLFDEHPLVRAQSRWALTQLSEFSQPFLISRMKQKRRGETKALLKTLIFMGSRGLSSCDALTKSIKKADKNTALTVNNAVKAIIGGSKSDRAKQILGPSYWSPHPQTACPKREEFEHVVWTEQVNNLFENYPSGDFEDVQSWYKDGVRPFRQVLDSWHPYKIVLRSGRVRLTHKPMASTEQELVTAKSPNGKYFTLAELCFLTAQNSEAASLNGEGILFKYKDDALGYPSYLVSSNKP